MTQAHRRKKQPDVLRPQLLQSAAQLALESGLRAVTLDAVAARAGVSKGGLQHHFRNKQALLDALFDDAVETFNADVA
ncbi:TetR/AcrR family transcriptional regulator, partial [Cupriavidus basilensis]|uniref:TetR/AcrR family transcriptional regulator n=2 Tax=Cupriavidus TaxID=106589 RepID=UPI0023E7BE26